MPISQSAKKSVRSSDQKRVFNDRRRRAMKEAVKKTQSFIEAKKVDEAKKSFPYTQKTIDKAVKRGVIKKNTAARKKSRIEKAIQKIS